MAQKSVICYDLFACQDIGDMLPDQQTILLKLSNSRVTIAIKIKWRMLLAHLKYFVKDFDLKPLVKDFIK